MTQQTIIYPTATRRPATSLLSSLFRRTPSTTPNRRRSGRSEVAYEENRRHEPGTYAAVTGHEWAILMTMRPH
jgi:hypothetical protein